MSLPVPDYELRARPHARPIGYRLVRTAVAPDTTLYGQIEYAVWQEVSADGLERKYWYEVRFRPFGTRWRSTWTLSQPTSDGQVNRLCFSVIERLPAHPQGPGKAARLGPIGHVRMWPRSAGLGTHLRDQLIDWVAAIHPDASVSKGVLSTVDADPENLERRTRFYKGANFNLVLSDDGSGSFWADRLGDLKRSTPDSRVVEIKSDEIRTTLKRMGELQEAKVTILLAPI